MACPEPEARSLPEPAPQKEALRRIQACCPTPVVILSVYKGPDVVRRAGEAGAGAYLVKPPSSDEMQRAITRHGYMISVDTAHRICTPPGSEPTPLTHP